MKKQKNLLQRGNSKLGESVHTWSIPAVTTCPGRTQLCTRCCYANAGRYRTHTMHDKLQANLDASLDRNFEARLVKEIVRRGVYVLRVGVAGDFYSPDYTRKWLRIARRCRRTVFYAYTRSWRLPEYQEVLAELAALSNFYLWFSVDAESGMPATVPEGVRLAFLQVAVDDDPAGSHLVFRTRDLRHTPLRRLGLVTICPTENAITQSEDKSCTSCRICFSEPGVRR